MSALIDDIQTQWAADATLSAVGGPWLAVAKDGATYPYAVYRVMGSAGEDGAGYHFDRTDIQTVVFRFTIFHTDDDALLDTYFRAMENLFVQQEFGDPTGTTTDKFVRCKRGMGGPVFDALPDPASDGKTVYFATGVYEFTTQRTLP
jgi:hypothetical protein